MGWDWLMSIDARAMAVAVTTNISCALVGVLLVVRRQSLMGDAISHAVLPGLVVAFLLSGNLGGWAMVLGALGAGLATTFLTETLRQRGGVSADAALGVVYTSLFALGVVMLKRYVNGVHFDVKCVYEGDLLNAALRTIELGEVEIPVALLSGFATLLVVLVVFTVLWKELKLCAFDAALADSMGFSSTLIHYLMMALTALVAAVSFGAVGAILVVAMMIAPAATAHLLTDRLARMAWIAALLAAVWGVVGYGLASALDVSPAGMMATVAGAGYGAAALFAPSHGALARIVAALRMSLRIRRDDLLALLYKSEERQPQASFAAEEALRGIGDDYLARFGLRQLVHAGRIEQSANQLQLTDLGRQDAARLVRSHRLWEAYLVSEVGVADDHVHEAAHVVEHYIDKQLDAEIEGALEGAEQDPHGREIPPG